MNPGVVAFSLEFTDLIVTFTQTFLNLRQLLAQLRTLLHTRTRTHGPRDVIDEL